MLRARGDAHVDKADTLARFNPWRANPKIKVPPRKERQHPMLTLRTLLRRVKSSRALAVSKEARQPKEVSGWKRLLKTPAASQGLLRRIQYVV
jgi:hypothetical protein